MLAVSQIHKSNGLKKMDGDEKEFRVKIQPFKREFGNVMMEADSVTDYSLRIITLVTEMKFYGENISHENLLAIRATPNTRRIIQTFKHVVPPYGSQWGIYDAFKVFVGLPITGGVTPAPTAKVAKSFYRLEAKRTNCRTTTAQLKKREHRAVTGSPIKQLDRAVSLIKIWSLISLLDFLIKQTLNLLLPSLESFTYKPSKSPFDSSNCSNGAIKIKLISLPKSLKEDDYKEVTNAQPSISRAQRFVVDNDDKDGDNEFSEVFELFYKETDGRTYLSTLAFLRDCILYFSTQLTDRQSIVDVFNSDTSIFACLLSTNAEGQGLNLIGAETVVIHDMDFNPQIDRQAKDHYHRIGKIKAYLQLVTKDTVDENIYEIVKRNLVLDAAVLKSEVEVDNEGDLPENTMGETLSS
ncbi:Helicase, C-terminal [Dillenia turbinata]|uniref:Helicase, C-terminal n=1 Tax=Dillenia turbinata TaxID=194707 RepID=A0AAN8USW2_9MAGN